MTKRKACVGTIFITGISAAGKSTLGNLLKDGLINEGLRDIILLDGEEVRKQLEKKNIHFGFSTEQRNVYSMELAKFALEHNKKGSICIVCAISHVRKTRENVRMIIGNFMEVFLDCSVDVCAKRDYKGNYGKAYKGIYDNFIGVTEPYQQSDKVELILDTNNDSVEECAKKLLDQSLKFIFMEWKVDQFD